MSGQTPGLEPAPEPEAEPKPPEPRFDAGQFQAHQERREDHRQAALGLAVQWAGQRAPIVCASIDGEEIHWDGYRPDRIDELARRAA